MNKKINTLIFAIILLMALPSCLLTQTPVSKEKIKNEPGTFETSFFAFRTGMNVISLLSCKYKYEALTEENSYRCPFAYSPDVTWQLLHDSKVIDSGAAVNYLWEKGCFSRVIGNFNTEAFSSYTFRLIIDSPIWKIGPEFCLDISGPGPK